jgi:hypothetical protein
VPGCPAAPPTPPTPPAPGPVPHFTPTNSTNCTWVEGVQYDHRVDNGAVTHADDREDCCRHCYLNSECVASAFHVGDGTCYLHFSLAGQRRGQEGVVGCVTARAAALQSVLPWPPQDAPLQFWVGGTRHPEQF